RGHDREEDLPGRHHLLGTAGYAGGARRAPAVADRDRPRGRDGRCERGREQSAGGQRPPASSAEDQGGTIVRNSQATARQAHFTERPRRYEEPGSLNRPKLALLKFELPKSRLPFSLMCVAILVATLVAVLLLNIFVSHTSYKVDQLRSEEHTSELQSRFDLVCRLLLDKK